MTLRGQNGEHGREPNRVRIESIGAGGDGVGRLSDGRIVFVPRSAPGDLVEIRLERSGRAWARGRPLEVLEAGRGRRPPPCPYADRCGGCALEHLDYDTQLEAKSRIIADALERIGKRSIDPPPVVRSPRTERYRNRASFSLFRLPRGRVVAGFRAWDDPDRIVDVDSTCLLFEEAIGRAWDALRAGWGAGARRLPGGRRLRLTLRATVDGTVSLLMEEGRGKGDATALLESVEGLDSIWVRHRDESARHLAGRSELTDVWDGVRVPLSGGTFMQVNREAAALLERHVDDCVGEVEGRTVIDAYAGVGLRARRYALRGATAIAVELDPAAVASGRRIGAEAGVTFVEGAVESVLERHLPADAVIVNPPRAGMDRRVADLLRGNPPDRIVYVSCDPATLARDLERLGDGFRIREVRGFDLFPQTAHVETVVRLERVG